MKTLQQQLEEAEAMVASVRKQLEAKEDTSKPNLGDTYWIIGREGLVIDKTWDNDHVDNQRLVVGNVFRTEEEAEKEVARRKVMKKLKDLAGGFVPDWGTSEGRKYHVYYDHRNRLWSIVDVILCQDHSQVYFPTEEAAQHAIDVLGDELDVLL